MFQLPDVLYVQNYYDAWTRGMFNRFYVNSVITTGAALVIIVFLGAMAGFAIEKMVWKRSSFVLKIYLSGIMIPGIMLLLPQFLIIKGIGLYNNLFSISLVTAMVQLPVAVYLYATFYRYLPDEVMESAVLDGCNMPQVFIRIIMPLSINTVATVIICSFFVFWNDFVIANTFVTKVELKTIQVGISFFVGYLKKTEWGPIFAGLCIGTLPTVALYLFLNKQVLSGVVEGSIKG